MNHKKHTEQIDPAAAFAVALSLHDRGTQEDSKEENMSEAYQGFDEFMRQCMNVGNAFETWCCQHVDWEQGIDDVWPYYLESHFAKELLNAGFELDGLATLGPKDFLKIAAYLKLPVKGFWKMQEQGAMGWGDVKSCNHLNDIYATEYFRTRAEAIDEIRSMGEQGEGMKAVRSNAASEHDFY
jgi:hypothetical protein